MSLLANDFNGNDYSHVSAMYKFLKKRKRHGNDTMPNGETLAEYFTRLFGITPKEFAAMPKPPSQRLEVKK